MTTDAPQALPDIDFTTFVLSLASSVLMQLGELAESPGPDSSANLPLAKQTIDIISMIEEKTKGNLTEPESNLLRGVLYDLRLKYVDAQKVAVKS